MAGSVAGRRWKSARRRRANSWPSSSPTTPPSASAPRSHAHAHTCTRTRAHTDTRVLVCARPERRGRALGVCCLKRVRAHGALSEASVCAHDTVCIV
eukprot:2707990-Rhodomonas_salina.1